MRLKSEMVEGDHVLWILGKHQLAFGVTLLRLTVLAGRRHPEPPPSFQ